MFESGSKFVPSPQSPVIQVASWLGFLQKTSRIKNSVISLKPKMSVHLPSHFRAGPVADEACPTVTRGSDQEAWKCVNTIFKTLPPLDNPVERGCDVMRESPINFRMEIDKVDSTWTSSSSHHAEIVSRREQGVKSSEWVGIRLWMIPAGDVSLPAESRLQSNRRQAITSLRANIP